MYNAWLIRVEFPGSTLPFSPTTSKQKPGYASASLCIRHDTNTYYIAHIERHVKEACICIMMTWAGGGGGWGTAHLGDRAVKTWRSHNSSSTGGGEGGRKPSHGMTFNVYYNMGDE